MDERLIGNLERGLVIVISAPSGAGKTTLVRYLLEEGRGKIVQSLSCTTRPRREGEVEGVDYTFISPNLFDKRSRSGEFIEEVTIFGNRYGTPRTQLEEVCSQGKHLLLVIDTIGAAHLKKEGYGDLYLFIEPPSLEELQRRLERRGSETSDDMAHRLVKAQDELKEKRWYDYVILNDHLYLAQERLRSIVIASECRVRPIIKRSNR